MATINTVKPAHHKPSHTIRTNRLLMRSPISSDAQAIYNLRSSTANNPFEKAESGISPEVFRERISNWASASEKGESGFMVIILPSTFDDSPLDAITADDLVVHDGKLIGFGGVNVFTYQKPTPESTEEVLVVDTGAMIDHRYWRQGFGIEAVTATVDYAFNVLDCGMVLIETDLDNLPWRTMMNGKMHLGEWEAKQRNPGIGKEFLAWRFDREAWLRARNKMLETRTAA